MTLLPRLYTICLAMLTMIIVASPSFAANTQEFTLTNGLKLIVREDHRAPIVVSQIWYKVGSADEPNGITGISHALEHMMFKGTPLHAPGEISKIVADNGGFDNAMTNTDYTVYFQQIAKDRLGLVFGLEADRMHNLILSPEEFKKEIQVVIAERRMRTDDNPQALTYERFLNTAHIATPYHHPVIGWLSDLENMTAADLKHWYQQWYTPNNAVLVVVGDVNPNDVFALAKQSFEKIPAQTLSSRKPHPEVTDLTARRLIMKQPANLPWLILGYNVPSFLTSKEKWHAYALEILAAILSNGESARFNKNLVRQQKIASSIDTSYDLYSRYDELLQISATPSNATKMTGLETAIQKEINKLQTTLVDNQELERAKTLLIAAQTFNKDSMMGQAIEIGSLEAVGLSWREADEYIKNIQTITPQQIQAVAKLYLVPERSTVAILQPQGKAKPTPLITPGQDYVH